MVWVILPDPYLDPFFPSGENKTLPLHIIPTGFAFHTWNLGCFKTCWLCIRWRWNCFCFKSPNYPQPTASLQNRQKPIVGTSYTAQAPGREKSRLVTRKVWLFISGLGYMRLAFSSGGVAGILQQEEPTNRGIALEVPWTFQQVAQGCVGFVKAACVGKANVLLSSIDRPLARNKVGSVAVYVDTTKLPDTTCRGLRPSARLSSPGRLGGLSPQDVWWWNPVAAKQEITLYHFLDLPRKPRKKKNIFPKVP